MKWIKEQLQKVRAFWKEPKNLWLIFSLAFVFFYLTGLLAQFFNNRYHWSPGEDLRLPRANPLKSLAMLFTPFDAQAIVGLLL